MITNIEWSIYDGLPPYECTCAKCETVFTSHAKGVPTVGIISRKPCPKCGENLMRKASSGIERMTIRK